MGFKTGMCSLLLLAAVALMSYNIPEGWFKAGTAADKYDMGTDVGAGQKGGNAATIRSIAKDIKGFGTLMQNTAPDNYKGKRIRLSGYIKTADVENSCGLWMRVDGKDPKMPLAFDDMKNRSVRGTNDWVKCKIVLDVPKNATNIAYGALLTGTGQMWFSNLKFEIVGNNVPTTDKEVTNKKPVNLDFKK